MGKVMGKKVEKPETVRTFGEREGCAGCGNRVRPGENISRRDGDERSGFVHALWLLVVLSAFLFGATLVNVAIGMKIHEASTKQSAAIENLALSVKEVRNSILYLSRLIGESEQAEEGDPGTPAEEGRI